MCGGQWRYLSYSGSFGLVNKFCGLFRVPRGLQPLACWVGGVGRVRIPPVAWISLVSCVVSRGLCDRPIIRPAECYVSECDLETSIMKRPWFGRAVEPCKKICNVEAV